MNSTKKNKEPVSRYKVMIGIMIVIFFTILCRVIYLQVFRYNYYSDKANTRSRRFISEQAPRGKIYDSEGNILATNKQTYTVTFTETTESTNKFYTTIDSLYDLLNSKGEKIQDNFNLKIDENNNFYFDFIPDENGSTEYAELRFKKDKGLDDVVYNQLVKNKVLPKNEGELTYEESEVVDEELLKITPEQTFYYLVESYNLYTALGLDKDEAKKVSKLSGEEITNLLLQKYSLNKIRDYMLVKDAIKMQSFSGFKPVTIARNIQEETAFILYQRLNDLPGVDISLDPIRYYPYGQLASSVLGYVSSINSSDKTKYEERGYDVSTDLIGKAGIESAFESELRGSKGGTTVTINSAGRKIDELFTLESYPGKNVHLTIDKDIQYSAETMLKHQLDYLQNKYRGDVNTKNATRGAVVAIEVETGRVLALASEPGFDPNIFAEGQLDPQLSKQLFSPDLEEFGNKLIAKENLNVSVDELFPKNSNGQRTDKYDLYPKPFYNYATMGLVAPGSTFKPLTSVALLEEGVYTPTETIRVTSTLFTKYHDLIGDKRDANYLGVADIKTALAKSSNTFYYEGAVRLYNKYNRSISGLNSIAKYAWKFGLGVDPDSNQTKSTGIEIAENFGQTYNFEDFKANTILYSPWQLVDFLENGQYGNIKFAPVDIEKSANDSDDLKEAKQNLKDKVKEKLNEIGDDDMGKISGFEDELIPYFQDIYNNSDKYKEAIKVKFENSNTKSTEEKFINEDFHQAAYAVANWVFYSMKTQITTASSLADAAIGQGMNSFTPVQLANYVATLANGGVRNKVHLVDKITDADGNVVEEFKPEVVDSIEISKTNLDAIKEGMRRVNHEVGFGTASSVFGNFPLTTAGKTGTATFREDQSKYGRSDFGVYISFAPLDKPKVAVAVVLYDGGHGYFGAPVARAIYETYFREEIKTNYPGYVPRNMDGTTYDWSLNPPSETIKDDSKDEMNKDNQNENIEQNQDSTSQTNE